MLDDGLDTGRGYKNEQEIIKTLLKLKSTGLTESTIKKTDERLSYLTKNNVNLMNPEEVKVFISHMKQANNYKQCIVKAYNYYAITNGIPWIKPKQQDQ